MSNQISTPISLAENRKVVIPERLLLGLRKPYACQAKMVGKYSEGNRIYADRHPRAVIKRRVIELLVEESLSWESQDARPIFTRDFPTAKSIENAVHNVAEWIETSFDNLTIFHRRKPKRGSIGGNAAIEGSVDLFAEATKGVLQPIYIELRIDGYSSASDAESIERMAIMKMIDPSVLTKDGVIFRYQPPGASEKIALSQCEKLIPESTAAIQKIIPTARLIAHTILNRKSPMDVPLLEKKPSKSSCKSCNYNQICIRSLH